MITGGALTFVVLATIMVTTSFLMSPVFEEIFGKTLYIAFSQFRVSFS
jgi:hypothetical protein